MTHIDSNDIRTWLDCGMPVYSRALGRIGEVVQVNDDNTIVIKSAKRGLGECVTTFEKGDPVDFSVTVGDGVTIFNTTAGR